MTATYMKLFELLPCKEKTKASELAEDFGITAPLPKGSTLMSYQSSMGLKFLH